MIKHLTKHGNSYALVIDKAILDLLHATPQTPFEIISDGRSLVLTPVRSSKDEQKFEAALAMVHQRFGRAMKKLGAGDQDGADRQKKLRATLAKINQRHGKDLRRLAQ